MTRVPVSVAVLAVLLALVPGCGSNDEEPPRTVPGDASSSPESTPVDPIESLARCEQAPPDGVSTSPVEIETSDGSVLAAARIGTGRTVLVLLHQTNGDGLCGWVPFAGLAAERGFTTVAIDMCGWGESRCSDDFELDANAQIQAAVEWARGEDPARRVVLVGASMGGSRAVLAAADGLKVDAYVDVSGPANWDTRELVDVAGQIKAPGLLVYAREDDTVAYAAARTVAKRSDGRFLAAPEGHGYEILVDGSGRKLSRFGREVLTFAERHGR